MFEQKIISHSKPWITDSDKASVREVLDSALVSQGEETKKFEKLISDYVGTNMSVACSSGTAALVLGLKTLDLTNGDEIIIPSYVCWNVLSAVLQIGGKPVICDVNEFGVIDKNSLEQVFSKKTKAIIAVHIFGHYSDIDSIMDFGVPVIEDSCQSFGQTKDNIVSGSRGTLGVYSFHGTKCLTSGVGGMLTSKNDQLILKAKKIVSDFSFGNFYGYGMSDLQSALGISQLNKYEKFIIKRKKIAEIYHNEIIKINSLTGGYQNYKEFLFRFTLRSPIEFEILEKMFFEKGIIIKKGVDELIHRKLMLDDSKFPNATFIYKENFSIPFYPALTDTEIDRNVSALKDIF